MIISNFIIAIFPIVFALNKLLIVNKYYNLASKYFPMKQIKTFQILDVLSKEDVRKFIKFMKSGLYNYNKNYTEIVRIYKKNNAENTFYSDSEMLNILRKNLNINNKSLGNRLSELYKLCESYLSIQINEINEFEKKLNLLDKYIESKSFGLFDKSFKVLETSIKRNLYDTDRIAILSELYKKNFLRQFLEFKNDKCNYYQRLHYIYRNVLFYLEKNIRWLELHLYQVYQYSSEYLSGEYFIENNIEELLDRFKKIDVRGHKFALMFHFIFKAYNDFNNVEDFRKSYSLFVSDLNILTYKIKVELLQLYSVYCTLQYNNHRPEFQKLLFEITKMKIDSGYLDELKDSSSPNFSNYAIVATSIGEIDWAKNFIKDYSYLLPFGIRDDEINYCLGFIGIHEKNYKEALSFLEKVKLNDYRRYLNIRLLKSRIYFKMNLYDEVIDENKRMRNYIFNKSYISKFYKNLVKYQIRDSETLIRFKFGKISKTDIEMYVKIQNNRITPWILEEIKKLKINI